MMLALHGVGGVVCLTILDDLISGYHHVACRFYVYALEGCGKREMGMSWMMEVGGGRVTFGCFEEPRNVNHVAI